VLLLQLLLFSQSAATAASCRSHALQLLLFPLLTCSGCCQLLL
jgi:hypothetical protein